MKGVFQVHLKDLILSDRLSGLWLRAKAHHGKHLHGFEGRLPELPKNNLLCTAVTARSYSSLAELSLVLSCREKLQQYINYDRTTLNIVFFLAYFLPLFTVGSKESVWAIKMKEHETTWEVWSQIMLSDLRDASVLGRSHWTLFSRNCLCHSQHY